MRDHQSIVVARYIAEEIRIQIPFIEVHSGEGFWRDAKAIAGKWC